jgi:DHA1 family tetracycline resistance protein-like MFS transporter
VVAPVGRPGGRRRFKFDDQVFWAVYQALPPMTFAGSPWLQRLQRMEPMSEKSARQPGVGFIFVTLVLSIVGFGLLIPVLPKLIVQYEGGDFTNGANTLKWIVGIYAFMQFVCSPILGSLSDRFGRRPIILIATAGSAIDYLIMASAPSLAWFFVARVIAGSTAGVLATANAYIADVTPPERRAQSFGLLGAAFGIGFIIGPVVGGLLGQFDLRLPFWFAAGCSAANWLWGYLVLPESLKSEHRRAFSWKRANPVGALMAMRRFPAVLGLVECFFILTLAQVMLQTTWALYTEERYGWSPLQIGLSLMFVGVATGLVQATLVKKVVPRLGDQRSVIVGMCISTVAFILYGLASHGWMIYAVVCFGCFAGIAGPALQSYTTKHIPPNEQGAVQGVFAGLQSLAGIPGPFIALYSFGWAISPERSFHIPGIAFFEGAVLSVLALFLALRSFRRDTQNAAAPRAPAVS